MKGFFFDCPDINTSDMLMPIMIPPFLHHIDLMTYGLYVKKSLNLHQK